MTYSSRDTSEENGSPFFLYEFNIDGTYYRYTDLPEDTVFNSNTWLKYPIKHAQTIQSLEITKNILKIEMPFGNDLTDRYVKKLPEKLVSFTLYRSHIGETEFVVIFKGRITTHRTKDLTLELNCENLFTSLKKLGLSKRYLISCPYTLYHRGCNVNKLTYEVAGTCTAAANTLLTVDGLGAYDDGYFIGGFIEFPDGTKKSILNHSGDQITISAISEYLKENPPISTPLLLYPGCDKTIATCKAKFNNLLNQGGFKWIPQINPMGGTSIV